MKQKKQNRILAALLAVAMMFQMLPMLAFAAEGDGAGSTEGEVSVNNNERFKEAVQSVPANGEITIHLGAGTYTLYEGDGPNGSLVKSGVKIHLVGEGIDITTLEIGGPLNDPPAGHEEQGSDYSFGGADTVTFEDMTLTTRYQRNYQGFSHINNETSVDRCKINGYTAYWGYNSATFTNTTFNAPGTAEAGGNKGYALWTYCSPIMTFNNCTFNGVGKVINVYTDYSAGNHDITVNFSDCTVHSSEGEVSLFNSKKTALNINDSNMGSFKYILNISGSNQVTAARDNTTCTQLFGFGGKSGSDTGRTEVYIDNKLVWGKKDGEPKGELKTHKYSDGVKDGKVTVTPGDWDMTKTPPEREVTEKCGYCNWEKTTIEYGYTLVYDLNGGTKPEDAAADEYDRKLRGTSDALAKAPVREGYQFLGWKINEGSSVYSAGTKISEITDLPQTGDITLTAQWEEITTPDGGSSGDGGSGDGGAGVVVAGALLGGAGYLLGTRLWLESTFGFVPANRIELAMALWKRADCPAPVSTELYPDIDEDDTDAQAAARWCVEQDLMKDFARTNSDGTQTVKFNPYDYVFRPQSLVKWYKLEKLLNEQQSTNA